MFDEVSRGFRDGSGGIRGFLGGFRDFSEKFQILS